MAVPINVLRAAKPREAKAHAAAVKAAGSQAKTASGATPLRKSKLISSKLAYKGRVFNVHADTVEEPNGLVLRRDVIRHSGSVVILAIDELQSKNDPELVIERQYRHAAGEFLLELPAGRIEPGEKPLAAAKREMIEETGYRAKRWTRLTKYFASPGFLGECMHLYLAREISAGVAQPEPDEQIEILRISLSNAKKLVQSGKIHDGKTLIGILLLDAAIREGQL